MKFKHKYNEESSDEEDLIRKVIKSQRPKNKSTSTNDLKDYVQGKHVNVEVEDFLEMDKNVRLKFEQLHKIKHKNKPVAKHIQTELTKGKDFAIQITDGEEMISHVDYRSRSMGHKDLPVLELVPNILSTEMNQVEERKHINRTYRKGSVNEHKWRLYNVNKLMRFKNDLDGILVQKVVTSTDLHKIKSIDLNLHNKI